MIEAEPVVKPLKNERLVHLKIKIIAFPVLRPAKQNPSESD